MIRGMETSKSKGNMRRSPKGKQLTRSIKKLSRKNNLKQKTLSKKCPQVLCAGSENIPSEIFLLSQAQTTPSASIVMMTKTTPVSNGLPDHIFTLAAATPVAHHPISDYLEVVNPTSVPRTSKKYHSRGLLFSKDSVYADSDEENKSFDLTLMSQISRQSYKDDTTQESISSPMRADPRDLLTDFTDEAT